MNAVLKTVLLALLAAASAAQSPPAFRSNTEIVVAPVTVGDDTGAPVRGLTRDDFRVYDNDARRSIESFWVDDDLPLTLGILIDASESQEDQLAEHRQTALRLLERLLRPGDRAFVISVAEHVRLWADLSASPADIRRAMAASPVAPFGTPCPREQRGPGFTISACGASPLWDAIYDAAAMKLRPLTGNKALLILTDGFDTGSARTWRQAADAAAKAEANVYAIQYRSVSGRSFAPDLYRLVAEAGGATFQAQDAESAAARLDTDLRHRYVLGFRPERLSGKARHNIRIEVTRPNLTVRGRQTYFYEPR